MWLWQVYSTMSRDIRDEYLAKGWEPFAVTSGKLGIMWHLRKQVNKKDTNE